MVKKNKINLNEIEVDKITKTKILLHIENNNLIYHKKCVNYSKAEIKRLQQSLNQLEKNSK